MSSNVSTTIITKYREVLQPTIQKIIDDYATHFPEIYDPVIYSLKMSDRPEISVLPFLTCKAFGNNFNLQAASSQATAYATLWASARTVDDILDVDNNKNGVPTVWGKYGTDRAILSSFELVANAIKHLTESNRQLGFDQSKSDNLVKLLLQHVSTTVFGELYDKRLADGLSKGNYVSIIEILEMLKTKVASWFYNPLLSGCLVANATNDQVSIIQKFGTIFGIAYGILNDIEDISGSFHDPLCGKINTVYVGAINDLKGTSDERFLRRIFNVRKISSRDLERAKKICNDYIPEIRLTAANFIEISQKKINQLNGLINESAKEDLLKITSVLDLG